MNIFLYIHSYKYMNRYQSDTSVHGIDFISLTPLYFVNCLSSLLFHYFYHRLLAKSGHKLLKFQI